MKIELLHYTPLLIAIQAIRTCWDSSCKSDSTVDEIGPEDAKLLDRIVNKHKHHSTIEHINYNFKINGISRACLQELARHRIASFSVESTRYTLKKHLCAEPSFKLQGGAKNAEKYVVFTDDEKTNEYILDSLENLRLLCISGKSNDITKYALPEALKVNLYLTMNARSLRNFLELRTSKSALWEIRELASNILNILPDSHKKYLFSNIQGGHDE